MRSSRQFNFLNSPNKLVFVRMYENTVTSLVGPQNTRTKTLASKNQLTK